VFEKLKPEVDKYAAMSDADKKLTIKAEASAKRIYHQGLEATSPTYVHFLEKVRAKLNELPSGAMAGLYTTVDNRCGVEISGKHICKR
jgi:hypothetical protein